MVWLQLKGDSARYAVRDPNGHGSKDSPFAQSAFDSNRRPGAAHQDQRRSRVPAGSREAARSKYPMGLRARIPSSAKMAP
jgi:hypothetical protein